jgi:GNAT superfamily N-acetyltransferase
MRSPSLDSYRLVSSSLGLRVPALHALKRLAYVDHFYHLTAPLSRLRFPRLRSDLSFAEASEADFDEIARGLGALDPASRKDIVTRLLFRRRGFTACHVGRSAGGELVSMQWLLRPKDNLLLEAHFPRLYYPLREGEVMVENVFVYPRFRGLGVFPTVNHHVLEVARREGFRTCNAYIRKDNLPSLNGFLALGFQLQRLLTGYNLAGISWRNLEERGRREAPARP